MDKYRRNFLKAVGVLGLGAGLPVLQKTFASETSAPEKPAKAPAAKQMGMVIDIQKCLTEGVQAACVAACRKEHNLPQVASDPERKFRWIWTESFGEIFPDHAHDHFAEALKEQLVLSLCNHCTTPACTKVCPVSATWKRKEDGIVMMDMHRCIGCRYCMSACPYRVRSFNWLYPRPDIVKSDSNPLYPTRTKGVVEKCTFCAERIRLGKEPACVEASKQIPGGEGALTFGNLSDPASEASRILREKRTISRQPGFGTRPNVYYIV